MGTSLKYPVYQPKLTARETELVNDCLESTWISGYGKYVDEFERRFAEATEGTNAISVCNGTVALHLALVALGIGEGDEVIVPTLTYIASVNAIKYVGAQPVFADSYEDSWQVDIDSLEARITDKTKAIICVHLYGHPCDMDGLLDVAERYGLLLIEDSAEALGTYYKGRPVGTFGNVSTYSFYGNKTITTGEGGMVTTSDPTLYDTMKRLKGQGLAKDREYWHDLIGYNYRMTNITAAIGVAQLERLEDILEKKRQLAVWYSEGLKDLPVAFHKEVGEVRHSYWMCSILTETPEHRDPLRHFLRNNGVETRPLFNPVHLMPMYATGEKFPVAENLASRGMNLPSYPDLEEDHVREICALIRTYFENR